MANVDLLKREEEFFASFFDLGKGEVGASRGQLLEKKIDLLEGLAERVSNRRSRRWLNDRLLIELVPRLNVEEIRGLFAPPPFGDHAQLSAFCMTNVQEWDRFRSIDMDVESRLINGSKKPEMKRKNPVVKDKAVTLNAWRRVDCHTRALLKRCFLSDILVEYEEMVRNFVSGTTDTETLVLDEQSPFHRLILQGVCQFYNVTCVTVDITKDGEIFKETTIKKKPGYCEIIPKITLVHFLKMAKEGAF
ncbi:R3H domain protein [Rhynchospora pubera]|uniref:R3H domain protein n=1 Tax=Rhynchospora pubera TaxID=906938 RepID=A0AAV8GUJ4_9POAL|nr:R3H domain protein [Rhynchospora pubera]KAJ4780267.1 R3H domain protein [Rhynchospora pubera]KAJ4787085.1 R3H domain protein [Rhynchospora pubera]KAJ4807286.1 R3H domain protein [Rhynchospora pubera]